MPTKYGFPIVDADNIFNVIDKLGIKKWPRLEQPVSLGEYLSRDLSAAERREAELFMPKAEAILFRKPNGGTFNGFRSVNKDWATVFTLLPDDLIPITIEFKHGSEIICVVPPSGVPNRKDFESDFPMASCAKREFQEETGIELEEVIPVGSPAGDSVSPRQSTQRYFPFLGIPKIPISQVKPRVDENEYLKVVLISLKEWMKLIEGKKIEDLCANSTTWATLYHLGRAKIR